MLFKSLRIMELLGSKDFSPSMISYLNCHVQDLFINVRVVTVISPYIVSKTKSHISDSKFMNI